MRSSSMQYHVHQKFHKHLYVSVVSTSLHFRHSQQAAIIVSVPIRMYKNVCMHFTYKYLWIWMTFPLFTILYCIIFTSPPLKSTMNLQYIYIPNRLIFVCIKLNWVRWPDSELERKCKSCVMKTSPKKAKSASVQLILEQLWDGRMWKGQIGSRILHTSLRTCWAPDCRTVCGYKLRYHTPPAAEQTHGSRVRCAVAPAAEDHESIKNIHMLDWPCQESCLNVCL